MKEYIVNHKHPILKQGLIIKKLNTAIVIHYSCGYLKIDNSELQMWIELGFVNPYSKGDEVEIDLSLNSIQKAVNNVLRIDEKVLSAKDRNTTSAYSKKIFCYFAKSYSRNSMKEIGEFIRDGYDHSTVHWAHKKISGLIDFDKIVTSDVNKIKKELNLIC